MGLHNRGILGDFCLCTCATRFCFWCRRAGLCVGIRIPNEFMIEKLDFLKLIVGDKVWTNSGARVTKYIFEIVPRHDCEKRSDDYRDLRAVRVSTI